MSLITDTRPVNGRISGFVLAGGASLRMGRIKAMLMINGETMLGRQIRLLRPTAARVVVVGGSAEFSQKFDVPFIRDLVEGRGPLAGIYTVLQETRAEYNFSLGCDLPFISRRLHSFFAGRAITSGSDMTARRSWEGRLQPLCGVHRRSARHAIRTSIAAEQNKVSSSFPKVRYTVIPWRDLAQAGFRASIFDKMNTSEDYKFVRRRLEGSTGPSA